jgi:response regulator RpfG family c-di-GMP phosphodiesterase
MTGKVLLVDDEPNILSGFNRHLRNEFELATAAGGEIALQALTDQGPFAVIVSDMQMPGMNGIQLLAEFEKRAPETVRIMLTGNADQGTAAQAINSGHIFRFLTKPCTPEDLARTITDALAQHRLITAEKELLQRTLGGAVKVLVDVLAIVDPDSFGRATKLRDWMRKMVVELKLHNTWSLDLAAMLAFLGYVTVPAEVMAKRRGGDELTEFEKGMLEKVPEVGRDLITNIPRLKPVADMVYLQRKGYDGSGLPAKGPTGDKIPIGARVLRVLIDLMDASVGQQPGPAAFSALDTRRVEYDPNVLQAARACLFVDGEAEGAGAGEDVIQLRPITGLLPGHQLVSDIKTESGKLVLAKGHVLSVALIAKIHNLAKVHRLAEPVKVIYSSTAAAS